MYLYGNKYTQFSSIYLLLFDWAHVSTSTAKQCHIQFTVQLIERDVHVHIGMGFKALR